MVQLVVPGQPEPFGHRLDALRPVQPQQTLHMQRRHPAPCATASQVEEWRKPTVKVGVNVTRQRNSGSNLHTGEMGAQTRF
jgi:hypothetical protein